MFAIKRPFQHIFCPKLMIFINGKFIPPGSLQPVGHFPGTNTDLLEKISSSKGALIFTNEHLLGVSGCTCTVNSSELPWMAQGTDAQQDATYSLYQSLAISQF
jgi:hypothetical protein